MKANHLFQIFLLFLFVTANCATTYAADNQSDSLKKATLTIIELKKNIDSLNVQLIDIQKKLSEPKKIECTRANVDFKWQHWLIIFFMPMIMLIFSVTFFIVFYRTKEFKISKLIGKIRIFRLN